MLALFPADDSAPVDVDRAVLFFGRHPDCDVTLTRSRKVSRRHCCVVQVNETLRVRDLGSMNGTYVNDKPVRRELPLKPGDELRVGDVGYVLRAKKSDAGPAPSGVIAVAPELLKAEGEPTDAEMDESDSDVVLLGD